MTKKSYDAPLTESLELKVDHNFCSTPPTGGGESSTETDEEP
jgi:hypothetical protein